MSNTAIVCDTTWKLVATGVPTACLAAKNQLPHLVPEIRGSRVMRPGCLISLADRTRRWGLK